VRLFRASPAFEHVSVVCRDIDPLPNNDAQIALLSLPYLASTDLVAADSPYLVPPDHRQQITNRSRELHVGIVWAGKPSHNNDHNRLLALSDLAPLLGVSGAYFHSLQLGDPAATIVASGFAALVKGFHPVIRDFADSAGLIGSLDLLISVDTAPAHLAGALCRPVWALLPFAPDRRW